MLAIGAASTFLSSILAKQLLTSSQFIDWAYLTSLVAVFFSFSLLGTEQLVVRCAVVDGRSVALPRAVARLIIGAGALFALSWLLFLDGRLFAFRLGLAATGVLLSVGLMQFAYQLQRTRGQLLEAQIIINAWKVLLAPAVLAAALWFPTDAALAAMGVALGIGTLPALRSLGRSWRYVTIIDARSDAVAVALPFTLSLGVLAVVNTLDRVVIERLMGAAVFANYFYVLTVLVTPFGVLANYLGFKEAVRYRSAYSFRTVLSDATRVGLASILLSALWAIICYAARGPLDLEFDVGLWTTLGALAVLKNVYAIASAAMGVKGSPRAIYAANVLTVIAVAALVAWAWIASPALTFVAAGYTLVWGVRLVAYLWLLPRTDVETVSLADGGAPA